jgi:hypothetical protein
MMTLNPKNQNPMNLRNLLALAALLAGCGTAELGGTDSIQSRETNAGEVEQVEEVEAPAPQPAPEEEPAPTPQLGASLGFAADTGDAPAANASFDIEGTYRVLAVIDWQNAGAEVSQRVEFYSPDGSLWSERSRTVSLPDQCAMQGDGSCRVWVSLPVSGTGIVDFGLSGQWTVKVYVDDSGEAMAEGSFNLEYAPPAEPEAPML